MGENNRHAPVFRIQTVQHVEHKGIVALGGGRNAPVKPMVLVQRSGHFLLLLSFFIQTSLGEEAAVPFVQTEGGIGDHHLELHELVVLEVLRIGERVALPNAGVIHAVEEHVHRAERPGLGVQLLTIDGNLAAGHLFVGLEQQAAASAGGVVDAVVFPRLDERGHQLGYLAWREELAALFARVGGKVGDHVLIGVSNDVCGAELTGTKIEVVEVFQQVAECRVLFLDVAEVNLGVEVDGAEHVAQLSAVVILDVGKGDVDLLADLCIRAVFVQIIEGGFHVEGEPLPAHGALDAPFVTVVLLHVQGASFEGDVAQVFHEQHGKDVVLVAGTVDFSPEAVAGLPENAFDIVAGRHGAYLISWSNVHCGSADRSSAPSLPTTGEAAPSPFSPADAVRRFSAAGGWTAGEFQIWKRIWR